MKMPSQKERTEFWKFAYAYASFKQVKTYCETLLSVNPPDEDPVRKGLTIAISISYACPFKQRSSVRLPPNVIPPHYKTAHNAIIEARDRWIAHKDIDGPILPFGFANQVRFKVSNRAYNMYTVSPLLGNDRIKEILALVKYLIPKMEYHTEKFLSRYGKQIKVPAGEYIMNLEKNPTSWLDRAPVMINKANGQVLK